MGPGPLLLMHSAATATSMDPSAAAAAAAPRHEEPPRELVYTKMERLVREMQHPESGVPVRSQKMFLSSIPYAFTGFDIVEWLMDRLGIDDYPEAVHLANLLCQHGYFFPVSDTKTLALKDDHALYRFQTPYFWPSHHQPDNTDYAIFLSKRSLRSKQKHALEEYEQEALNRLKKLLCHKWEFISMQAEEQANLAKERKKTDKVVLDSQERAYWRVHRPPPGYPNCLEKSPVMNRKSRRRKNKEDLAREVDRLKQCLNRASSKTSQAVGSLINRFDSYAQFDPFMSGGQSCNPWISDDTTLWALNGMLVEVATEKRVRRWALGLGELLADATGVREFQLYLKKEYSEENLRFWQAVLKLRQGSQQDVPAAAQRIHEEHLLPGAPYEVNLDSKTVERIQEALSAGPTRYTFDAAQGQVYALMEKDTYPRFLRSDHYQHLILSAQLQHPHKKKFFHFGGTGGKKTSKAPLSPQQQPKRPQGASGLSGSHVDLSAASKQEMRKGSSSEVFEWPFCGRHSHSTSDLHNLDAMAKLTSSRLSSPATSRECVLTDSTRATTLQVPRLSHRSSDDGSSSPEEGSSLSLAVPPVGPPAKNVVAPWEEEDH